MSLATKDKGREKDNKQKEKKKERSAYKGVPYGGDTPAFEIYLQ